MPPTDAYIEAEFLRLRRRALAFAGSLMLQHRSPRDPEDIVQTAYLHVWARRQHVENVKKYLMQAVYNEAMTGLRPRLRTGGYDPSSDGLDAVCVSPRVQERLEAHITVDLCLRRLQQPMYRLALCLWLTDSVPAGQSTHRVRVHRAMDEIRKAVGAAA